MRALILALFILGILISAHSARAGLSSSPRQIPASAEPTSVTDVTNQQSEDQVRLTRAKRVVVQRRLTKLGFEAKANGKFDDATRDAISRWQEQHGYPKTGFLNSAQHQALLSERPAAAAEADNTDDHDRHHGRRGRRSRSIGGPIGAIGHVVGGILGR